MGSKAAIRATLLPLSQTADYPAGETKDAPAPSAACKTTLKDACTADGAHAGSWSTLSAVHHNGGVGCSWLLLRHYCSRNSI